MRSRNKQLEKFYNLTVNNFQKAIKECKKYAANMIKRLNFENPDPHVAHLIDAYHLIHASYRYEGEILANKQLTSVLFNILKLYLYPPMGMLCGYNMSHNRCLIKKNTIIKDSKTYLRVIKDTYIHNIKNTSKNIVFRNGKSHLQLDFDINGFVDNLEIFAHPNVIKALFFNNTQKSIIVQNTNEYSTQAMAVWNPICDLQAAICFSDQYSSFTINNIDNTGLSNTLSIYISIERQDDLLNYDFSTNSIVVSNDFMDTTQNIHFMPDNTEYWFSDVDNKEIIDVVRLYVITETQTIEITRCTEDADGWYVLVNDDQIGVGFGFVDPSWIYFFCEIKAINKDHEYVNPIFEEYLPITLEWKNYLSKVERNIYKNKITNITALLNINLHNICDVILNFIKSYDPFQLVDLSLIKHATIGNIERYGNFQYVSKGVYLELATSSENIIIIYGIMNEITKRLNMYCAFHMKTPIGIITYESKYMEGDRG